MKILSGVLFITVLSIGHVFGQSINYSWTVQNSGDQENFGRAVTVDPNGNVISTGTFRDTVDFDPGAGVLNLVSGGFDDVYIQKLDSDGNLIWANSFTGNLGVVAYEIISDDLGDIYLAGSYRGTIDFDPGPGVFNMTSVGFHDVFVAKLLSDGSFSWAKSCGGSAYERAFGLDIDSEGNVFLGGYFSDSVDFDPGPGTNYIQCDSLFDAFILKLDPLGDFVWARTYPNDTTSIVQELTVDIDDNVIASGYFAHTMDFDPGPAVSNKASNGLNDLFVTKLDNDGNLLWVVTEGSIEEDHAASVTTDKYGDIYFTGGFKNTVDFDDGTGVDTLTSNAEVDIYVQKLSSDGIHQWVVSMGSVGDERGRKIVVDTFDYVYVVGDYVDTVDFDAGPGTFELTSDSTENIFLLKLDFDGNFVDAKSGNGPLADLCHSVITDNNGAIYITGAIIDSVDFDLSSGSGGYFAPNSERDAYLTKYVQCVPTASSISVSACNNYTSPSGNYFWTTSGLFIDTLIGGNSCSEDSIIFINLAIEVIDTTVNIIDAITLEANGSFLQYQWVDCDNGYAALSGETNQVFTASQNGNYAVVVSNGTCTDTSECININSVGIDESSLANQVIIYPNPTEGLISINAIGTVEINSIEITNVIGQQIKTLDVDNNNKQDIYIEGKPGIYFIKIVLEGGDSFISQLVKI